ncbi:bifunctional 2',3'-cyclic nucleotide 2'-phosphodiesterase/3'-nucleotidase precursor protein [Chlamydia abortus]|nr:bifunctional 2',3'-cyclic nucleotide 2'-phosphodiesterase/3'-nucleotidase precursor protein [Chlamydia abortus]
MNLSRTERKMSQRKKMYQSMMRATVILFFLMIVTIIGLYIWMEKQSSAPSSGSGGGPDATAIDPASSPKPSTMPSPSPSEDPVNFPSPSPSPEDSGESAPPAEPDRGDGSKKQVTLSFVGDVLLGSTVNNLLSAHGYEYPYQDVRELLQKPDLTIANLETPITDRGTAEKDKTYIYRSSPEVLPAFKEAGFDLVNLANNHTMDYGVEGLLDTLGHLDEQGILRVGAGRDADEAFQPVIVEKNGLKIAFLGFTKVVPDASWKAGLASPGLADTYSHIRPVREIEKAKEQADLVIVIAHWGEERKDHPNQEQIDLAHRYIDAGADLIIGGHPHVLQGFEQYKGKWIAYSLGNFIFTTNNNAKTLETVILEATCSTDGCDLKAVPIFTQWAKPVVMEEQEGQQLYERLTSISRQAFVDKDGYIHAQE